MAEFRMPALGAEMEAGRVVAWKVKPGDHVARGDVVATVDTDKAEIDVEIFDAGVIDEILVPEGERVSVGTVLAQVRADGKAPSGAPRPTPSEPQVRAAAHRPRVSPLARRIAAGLGVDLAQVTGSGEGGAITKRDVESAAASVAAAPPPPSTAVSGKAGEPAEAERARAIHTAAMRTAIARTMARSKREIPHYYLGATIDMSAALGWLEEQNSIRPVAERLLPAALLIKAVALAAREVPEMNGSWEDGEFRVSPTAHVGVAISLRPGGLVAPAIHDVGERTVDELMAALRDLVQRARSGRLRGSEMADATITVSNLGEQGVETVFGVIYPPQVALVGFGKLAERPWAESGMLGVRPTVEATLSGDHRASDGHRGAVFLAAIDRLLQAPGTL